MPAETVDDYISKALEELASRQPKTMFRFLELTQASEGSEAFDIETFTNRLVELMKKYSAILSEADEAKLRANFDTFLTIFF